MNNCDLPTARDDNLLYNISREEADNRGAMVDEITRFYWTSGSPPDMRAWEEEEIQDAVETCAMDSLIRAGRSNLTTTHEEIASNGSVGFVTFDRTAHFAVCEPDFITPDLIDHLRFILREQFPLWRVRFVIDETDDDILVYPDGVCIGDRVYSDDFEAALALWVRKTDERWEQWRGPRRRQFRWVKAHVRELIARFNSPLIEVVAVFDSACGIFSRNFDEWMAWTLSRHEPRRWLVAELPVAKHCFGEYPVDGSDVIGVQGMPGDSAAYRLDLWSINRSDHSIDLGIKVWPDGPMQVTSIHPSDVITDEFLQRLEQSGDL